MCFLIQLGKFGRFPILTGWLKMICTSYMRSLGFQFHSTFLTTYYDQQYQRSHSDQVRDRSITPTGGVGGFRGGALDSSQFS